MELQLQDVRKQYGEKCAVGNVSANLVPGVYGLLGANGAGKTTNVDAYDMRCFETDVGQHPAQWENSRTIGREVLYPFRIYATGFWLLS